MSRAPNKTLSPSEKKSYQKTNGSRSSNERLKGSHINNPQRILLNSRISNLFETILVVQTRYLRSVSPPVQSTCVLLAERCVGQEIAHLFYCRTTLPATCNINLPLRLQTAGKLSELKLPITSMLSVHFRAVGDLFISLRKKASIKAFKSSCGEIPSCR